MKLNLKDVTLVGVDCLNIDRLIKAANVCSYYADFYDIKLLTSIPKKSIFKIINIQKINSNYEYSKFILKELDNYFETDFVLVFQWDGFILNPDVWLYNFLNYDYIGAPWFHSGLQDIGGNGGFSLRSKKLQNILKNNSIININN